MGDSRQKVAADRDFCIILPVRVRRSVRQVGQNRVVGIARGDNRREKATLEGGSRKMAMIIGALSPRTRWAVLIGFLSATLLVADTLAHPIVQDDRALSAAGGSNREDPGEPAALTSGRALPVDLLPQPLPVSLPDDGRFVPPADTLPGISSEPSLRPFDPGQLPIDVRSSLTGDKEVNPFPTARRPTATDRTRQDVASSRAGPTGSTQEASSLAGEEIGAAIRDLEESIVDAIVAATDARMGPEGRASFSLFGVEGFHFAAKGGQVSIGHGDLSLSVTDHAGSREGEQTRQTAQRGPQQLSTPGEPDGGWTIRRFILEIVQYPLFWVVILMLLIGKIALTIASRRGRRRTHRRHSRSSQQVKVKRMRTRKRVRIRLKRPPSPVGLQEP